VPDEPAPPRLVERWEALQAGQQAAIAYPVLAVVLAVAHWAFPGLRDNPLLALSYGLLWAIPVTVAVVSATAFERRERARRRAARDAEERAGADGARTTNDP
jgi:hypothetical protein